MSAPGDFSRRSWRLKLARAQKHFEELQGQIARYGHAHPYEARREHQGKPNKYLWRYVLRITKQPDPEIAITIGDIVHNLRSALDHLAVAIAPRDRRDQASFPIVDPRVSSRLANGDFIINDDEVLKSFSKAVKGMPPEAVALIVGLQPAMGVEPMLHPAIGISRIDNEDKHRSLVTTTAGLLDVVSIGCVRGVFTGGGQGLFCPDGTEIFKHNTTPPDVLSESEVQVYVRGTPAISVNVGIKEGNARVVPALEWMFTAIPQAFDLLEKYVRE